MSVELRPQDLRRIGVRAVFGDLVPGAGRLSTPVHDPALAGLLARADALVHGGRSATWLDGVLTTHDGAGPLATVAVAPATDLGAVAERLAAAAAPTVLVGPGLVREAAVPALRAFAVATGIGVLNTWGAKGAFAWDSPHHLGTVGLQADDATLSGLAASDLVLTCGLDADEAPGPLEQAIDVEAAALVDLAGRWRRPPRRAQAKPPLWDRIAEVTQSGWADPVPPVQPSQVTRTYADVLGGDGLLVADPGVAGFWAARTFPTVRLGSVVVPSSRRPAGLAAACALAARLRHPQRSVLLAVDDPIDPSTLQVLELADRLRSGFGVEVWSLGERPLGPRPHATRAAALAISQGRSTVERLTTDSAQIDAMVAAAGPVVAWS